MVAAIGLRRPDYCKIQIFQFVFKIVVSTCFHNYSWKSSTKQNSFGQPAYKKIAHSYNPGKLGAQVEVKRQKKFAINHARFSFYYYFPLSAKLQ